MFQINTEDPASKHFGRKGSKLLQVNYIKITKERKQKLSSLLFNISDKNGGIPKTIRQIP